MNSQDGRRRINDWDELYPGRFLKAGLIPEGEKRILTISAIDLDELEGEKGKRVKGVISFREEQMQLPLNRTNGICLREMFGRVPWQWEGKRVALFQTEWGGEPAIRVWGSPDIEADIEVEIALPRRRPFKMTMHAMPPAGPRAVKPVATKSPGHSPEVTGLLKEMAAASSLEALMDIEADMAIREFSDQESALLARAATKRRRQLEGANNGQ